MELTKRQEKQLTKVFNDPKKLRKWIDKVYEDMIRSCEKQTKNLIYEYMDIYSIAVAYTLRYVCGFGKKRLPEVMERIWNNVDAFKDGYIDIQDCIDELYANGVQFENILSHKADWRFEKNDNGKRVYKYNKPTKENK